MGKTLFTERGRLYAVRAKVCRSDWLGLHNYSLFFACFLLLVPMQSKACTSVDVVANDINVGQYNSLSADATRVRFDLQLECQTAGFEPTTLLPFGIGLSSMNSGGADSKMMKGVRYNLLYGIYTGSNLVTPWGSVGSGRSVSGQFPAALVPSPQVFSGYLNVPAKQNVPSGSYSDSLMVTIEF